MVQVGEQRVVVRNHLDLDGSVLDRVPYSDARRRLLAADLGFARYQSQRLVLLLEAVLVVVRLAESVVLLKVWLVDC